jgi:YHS domain-containing protein
MSNILRLVTPGFSLRASTLSFRFLKKAAIKKSSFVLIGLAATMAVPACAKTISHIKAAPTQYRAHCGMIYSAAEAKKDHYICPMDHMKMVPIESASKKAPKKVALSPLAAERALFLTPGGIYSLADIRANGRTTPAQKYAGIMAQHDMNPTKGMFICPITHTKSNAKFTWVVGGKTYRFCCPPCIAEFVKEAKTQPQRILPPQDYVKG